MAKTRLCISGTVQEVRAYSSSVILFVKANSPEVVGGKTVRIVINGSNCSYPQQWASLAVGDDVQVMRRITTDGKVYFSLSFVQSSVVDATHLNL